MLEKVSANEHCENTNKIYECDIIKMFATRNGFVFS